MKDHVVWTRDTRSVSYLRIDEFTKEHWWEEDKSKATLFTMTQASKMYHKLAKEANRNKSYTMYSYSHKNITVYPY